MRAPILHIIPFLWSGAGAVVTRLCEAQARKGPVALVTSGRQESLQDWDTYRRRLRRAGVTHHTIDTFHRADHIFWSGIPALAGLIRTLRPAVIHAHAGVPCCSAAMARTIAGHRVRIIGQMYSWGPDRPDWMNVQDTWGFAQADRVVCSADAYWQLLRQYGVPQRKLVYLPWGLPLDELPLRPEPARSRHVVTPNPVIGFVGRIEPRKGQIQLVEAFAHLRRSCPGARLELVGPVADQAYGATLTATIDRLALDGSVTLTGQVRQPSTWMRRWDLFVSLSSDEGQGLAVLEAMALGVPVAARPVAGISDFLVDRRTGFALTQRGATTTARALRDALSTPVLQRRVARAARQLVERRYSWDRTVRAFERLYQARPVSS